MFDTWVWWETVHLFATVLYPMFFFVSCVMFHPVPLHLTVPSNISVCSQQLMITIYCTCVRVFPEFLLSYSINSSSLIVPSYFLGNDYLIVQCYQKMLHNLIIQKQSRKPGDAFWTTHLKVFKIPTILVGPHVMIQKKQTEWDSVSFKTIIHWTKGDTVIMFKDGGSLPMWQISNSRSLELKGCPPGYLWSVRLTKVRTSNDLLVTFASLYQTAHASSPPPPVAQFQQQKHNQRQHWPAVCVKNMVFMSVRPSSRVGVRSNWVKWLTAFRSTADDRQRKTMKVQRHNSPLFSEFKHVWLCMTRHWDFFFFFCRAGLA